jgi:acetyltransferase-like isoleucine patch superfamily enzyme
MATFELLLQMKKRLRFLASLLVVVLPLWLKIPIYRRIFRYKIGSHAKIGLSWINVGKLEIGDYVVIRDLVRFKNIPEVRIEDHCTISFGTTFTSTPEFTNPRGIAARGNRPMLIIGRHCGITMLHYFDIQDAFTIGDYTTIAGRGSVFFTHYLDVITGMQCARPISIGRYCMIGSNVRFAPGAGVGDCCVVGIGAVVTKAFAETHRLIVGNPAAIVRELPEEAAYFKRAVGWVGSYVHSPDGSSDNLP